ncbi:MAG: cytochrome c [Magnetospirillum sp. WYHS-4]
MPRILAVVAAIFWAQGALAASDEADAGRALAVRWCASCHVVEANRGGTDAVAPFQSIADRPQTTEAGLKGFLVRPHGQMPDFQLALPHIDAIVAYLMSLRGRK